MIIREYKPKDCSSISKLFYETIHRINAKDYTKEQIDVWATGIVDLEEWNRTFLEHDTLIAEIDKKIVGFADMDNSGYLDRLYVDKDFLCMGIGTALIRELEQRARKNGLHFFETNSSITAKSFFEKQGYVIETENKVIRDGVTLMNYRMKKCIID